MNTSNLLVSYQYKKQFSSDIKMECLNPKCHKKKNLNVHGLCDSCAAMCESLRHIADEPKVVTDNLDEIRCILDKKKNNKYVDYNMTALFRGILSLSKDIRKSSRDLEEKSEVTQKSAQKRKCTQKSF